MTCLISDSMDELEEMLQNLDESCNEMDLTISTRKMKIMAVAQDQKQSPRQVQLQSADEPVDVVEEFEYFGSIVMSDCELDREINVQIRRASSSFRSLYRILWYQQKIKMSTKMRMFKAAILPTLLCGSETWAPLAKQVKPATVFCDAVSTNHIGSVNERKTETHRH